MPNVTGGALAALEHFATVRENRTGVSRYNQGLDAESLNKTLGGLDRIMSASQQRQDLIARTFAETAIKRLYRLIYRAIKRAATGPVSYWTGRGEALPAAIPANGREHGAVGRCRGHRQPRAGAGPSLHGGQRCRRS